MTHATPKSGRVFHVTPLSRLQSIFESNAVLAPRAQLLTQYPLNGRRKLFVHDLQPKINLAKINKRRNPEATSEVERLTHVFFFHELPRARTYAEGHVERPAVVLEFDAPRQAEGTSTPLHLRLNTLRAIHAYPALAYFARRLLKEHQKNKPFLARVEVKTFHK